MKKSQLFNIAYLVLIMPFLIGCLAKNNPEPDPRYQQHGGGGCAQLQQHSDGGLGFL